MRTDTIAAIATPNGRGGVGIVRVSGPNAHQIAQAIVRTELKPRQAHYLNFLTTDNQVIDRGLALFFPNPHSFTGEDVLELQGHGGPVVMDLLLDLCLKAGARLANPGEFTERAFLNDKIDLAQAEAVADLIDASSREAALSAMTVLEGQFSERVHALLEQLIHLRMYVEAAIDFPEEEIDFLNDGHIKQQLDTLQNALDTIVEQAETGRLLQEGLTVVIAGKPNAGKSSLLNALVRQESAIVTAIPGTTRDVVQEKINVSGVPLHIIDTAGIRNSQDVVEQEGIRRTKNALNQAHHALLVIDASIPDAVFETINELKQHVPEQVPLTIIFNKTDVLQQNCQETHWDTIPVIQLSAKTGEGLMLLEQHLLKQVGFKHAGENQFIARRRHVDALVRAQNAVSEGKKQLEIAQAGELLAEELLQAQNALGEITGKFRADDLLGEIFSSFCIGK